MLFDVRALTRRKPGGTHEPALVEPVALEPGTREARAPEVTAHEMRVEQMRRREVAVAKRRVLKAGSSQVGSGEVHSVEVRALKVVPDQERLLLPLSEDLRSARLGVALPSAPLSRVTPGWTRPTSCRLRPG